MNTYFSFVFSLSSSLQVHNNMAIDMNINIPKSQSINSNVHNSRKSFVYSSILLIAYIKRVQALNHSFF